MFKDKSEKWKAEFYEYYAKVGLTELRTEKRILKSENEMEFVFQNFIRSHIIYLPSLSKIKWKLVGRGNVEKVKRVIRGKEVEEYLLMNTRIESLDGEVYKVQFRTSDKRNEFEYSNPEEYLKYYPEIDELIYMCEIIDLIRNEFHIWKK
ncbi:hypothetical protein [Mariniflexile sp. HMF6888]|uniref:hypothetical protein n=1 Tax=Mariniflexile sp. HMF6888 TaxID=3373086 RepID=UPI0037952C02